MTQQDSDESHHRSKYYVITEDLEAVLQPWAQRHGFTLPTREFLNSLRKEMGAIPFKYALKGTPVSC